MSHRHAWRVHHRALFHVPQASLEPLHYLLVNPMDNGPGHFLRARQREGQVPVTQCLERVIHHAPGTRPLVEHVPCDVQLVIGC